MSLDEQKISINFGQGVDTKTDPKLVVAGRLLRLENAIFTSPGRITKRNGYATISAAILGSASTITSPKLTKSFQNELVCADSVLGRLYSYSPTRGGWSDRGKYVPVGVSSGTITKQSTAQQSLASGVVSGGIATYSWEQGYQAYATVRDTATGTVIIAPQALSSGSPPQDGSGNPTSSSPKSCILGASTAAVFYRNAAGSLAFRTLLLSGTSASFQSEIVLSSTLSLFDIGSPYQSSPTPFLSGQYAVCNTPSGGVLAVATSTGLYLVPVTTSGFGTPVLVTAATGLYAISINYEASTGNIWLYWSDNTVKYAVYNGSLSQILAPTTAASPGSIPINITAYSTGTGTQNVLYTNRTVAGSFLYANNVINKVSVTSAGSVGSSSVVVTNLTLLSMPFQIGQGNYVCGVNFSKIQPTVFVIDLADGVPVAKAVMSAAPDFRQSGFLTRPMMISSTIAQIAVGATHELVATTGTLTGILGVAYAQFDFAHRDAYQALDAEGTLLMNGGFISAYDGLQVAELGFHLFPDNVGAVDNSAIAFPTNPILPANRKMANGTYQYFVTYRYTDSNGNIYESAPSPGVSVTLANGTDNTGSVKITVDMLSLTGKPAGGTTVEIRIYRTLKNGIIPFNINTIAYTTSSGPYANNPSQIVFTVTDGQADSAINGNGTLYTNGGVIENIAPPAAMAMVLHQERVWLINSESPNQLWPSKKITQGAGVNFSDLFTVQVGAQGGSCTALASMDEKLIAFEQSRPYVIVGDAPNDAGTGSTLSTPQSIPSDVGCFGSKGIATFTAGVLFKSTKGIYLLDRALNVKYVGKAVEAYNSQNIVAATLIPDKTQIRFLCDSGLTLAFDYDACQWSTFTNHAGYSADVWQGKYVYARTDGKIFQESPGYYLDGSTSFAVLAQTSWLAVAGVQGLQRIWELLMLGDYANGSGGAGHGVQVSLAFDGDPTFGTPVPYTFGSASSSGVFRYRQHMSRQKCASLSLLIQEVTTGDSADSLDLTDMSFRAGVKRGLARVAQSRSVG
jgi:hypothetical protein